MQFIKFNVREILAAGAVVLSLLFVAIELRQNTEAAKAAALMDYYAAAAENYSMLANDPELARITVNVFFDPEKLSQADHQRFFAFKFAGDHSLQGAYRLWTMGVLPDEEWESALRGYCPREQDDEKIVSTMQRLWNMSKPSLMPSFVEVVERACGFSRSG